MQTARNFGHVIDSTQNGEVMGIYRPGQFPGVAITEPVTGVLQNLFLEHYINEPPVSQDNWSGISGDLLVSPDGTSDWTPILRFDLPSSNKVRRLNLLTLAWEGTPAIIAPTGYLAIQLVDVGHGFLKPGSFIKIWGSALELTPDAGTINIGSSSGSGGSGSGSGSGGSSTPQLTASQIRDLLQSLTGNDRLDASAVEGLPVAGGNFGSIQWQENGLLRGSGQLTYNQVGLPAPGVFAPNSELFDIEAHDNVDYTTAVHGTRLNDGGTSLDVRFGATSGNNPQWVSIDLGSVRSADGISIGSSSITEPLVASQNFLNGCVIQASSFAGQARLANDWQTIGTVTGFTGSGMQILTFQFNPRNLRHVRIFNPLSGVAFALTEFRVRIAQPNQTFSLLSAYTSALWISSDNTAPSILRPGEVRARFVTADSGFWVGGEQVVGARRTGWTAGTGTPNIGAFNATTATVAQVAARVLALEEAMRNHGLIN